MHGTHTLDAVRHQLASVPNIAQAEKHAQRSKRIELLACTLAFIGLVTLFSFVKPAPASQHRQLSMMYDFRSDLQQPQIQKRMGRTTRNAGGADVLKVLGARSEQADAAIDALRTAGFISGSEIGANIMLTAYFDDNSDPDLISLFYRPTADYAIFTTRHADGTYFASQLTAQTVTSYQAISGTIETTLADALTIAGGKSQLIAALAMAFPEDPSLNRGGSKGDQFEIVYEVFQDTRNQTSQPKLGGIAYASYISQNQAQEWYHYTPHDTGRASYFTANGQAARLVLSRQPIHHSFTTSGFGIRAHPVTGDEHLHTGVDYSAPRGTPVYAAESGTIRELTNRRGYGRYIRIQHANGIATAYAHLSGYERALHIGKQVKRGDLIGFVGNSGTATGTHLHFEVHSNGVFENPLTLQMPEGRKLSDTPEILADFIAFRKRVDAARYDQDTSILLAQNKAAARANAHKTP
jgi:murein DD-endopeptidase MepM/ murein hydrolase activator NlpD